MYLKYIDRYIYEEREREEEKKEKMYGKGEKKQNRLSILTGVC